MTDVNEIARNLKLAMQRDRFYLRRFVNQIRQKKLGEDSSQFKKMQELWSKSTKNLETRQSRFPQPKLDQELPLFEKADQIKQAMLDHQVVVISGETGSGKSLSLIHI